MPAETGSLLPFNLVESSLRGLLRIRNGVLLLAYAIGWFQHQLAPLAGLSSAMRLHLSTASLAALFSLFMDLCVMFYFIGTSVWMRDRSKEMFRINKPKALNSWDTYQLANKLKGPTMPFATFGLVLGLFAFILGGATDVGAVNHWIHPLLASLLVLNSFVAQKYYFRSIEKNLGYLDHISSNLDTLKAYS